MLDRASAKAPEAVSDLKDQLKTYSALKRIEKVFDQRINYAKANASGASVPSEFQKNIKEWKHSPVGKAVTVIPEALAAKKKQIDKDVARAALNPATGTASQMAGYGLHQVPTMSETAKESISKLTAPAKVALDAIATAVRGKTGSKVVAAIKAGVPRALAMQAAEEAARRWTK